MEKFIIYKDKIPPTRFWTGTGWSTDRKRAKVMPHWEASQKCKRMLRSDEFHAKTIRQSAFIKLK